MGLSSLTIPPSAPPRTQKEQDKGTGHLSTPTPPDWATNIPCLIVESLLAQVHMEMLDRTARGNRIIRYTNLAGSVAQALHHILSPAPEDPILFRTE